MLERLGVAALLQARIGKWGKCFEFSATRIHICREIHGHHRKAFWQRSGLSGLNPGKLRSPTVFRREQHFAEPGTGPVHLLVLGYHHQSVVLPMGLSKSEMLGREGSCRERMAVMIDAQMKEMVHPYSIHGWILHRTSEGKRKPCTPTC